MGELLQTVQPEVKVLGSHLSQQALIELPGHAVITLQRGWKEPETGGKSMKISRFKNNMTVNTSTSKIKFFVFKKKSGIH